MLKEVAIVRLKISESERITPKFEFMEQILELEANRERENGFELSKQDLGQNLELDLKNLDLEQDLTQNLEQNTKSNIFDSQYLLNGIDKQLERAKNDSYAIMHLLSEQNYVIA